MTVEDARANPLLHETLLGEAAERMAMALFVLDDDGRVITANGAASRLTGWSLAELLELEPNALSSDPARADERRVEIDGAVVSEGAGNVRTRDGGTIPVRFTASRTTVAGMSFLVVACMPA